MTRPYESLTEAGQFRRIRKIAERALPAFPIAVDRLRPLGHGENTTFRVDGRCTDTGRSERFLLRVARPDYQTDQALRSECAWLESLEAAGLAVPGPVRAHTGDRFVRVEADDVPGERRVLAFRWVRGRFRYKRSLAALERVGRLTATLHTHANAWTPPAGFERILWDADGLLGATANWGTLEGLRPQLDDLVWQRLERARAEAWAHIHDLGLPPDHAGLIHADLHAGNVVHHFDGGQPEARAIDFDDAGVCHHLYDVAVTLGAYREDLEARARYLIGYRSVRDLPDTVLHSLDWFFVARALNILVWVYARSDVPSLAAWRSRSLARTLTVLEAYGL